MLDFYLGCHTIPGHNQLYSESILRSTYLPVPRRTCLIRPPFKCAKIEASHRKSMPNIQDAYQPTRVGTWIENNSQCGKRARSPGSIPRSVSGMKHLMPLKLATSQAGDPEWSQRLPMKSPTFGPHPGKRERPFSQDPESYQLISSVKTSSEPLDDQSHTIITMRPEDYRDVPIYNESGSPVLGRAYYGEDGGGLTFSPPGSTHEESCIIGNHDSPPGLDFGSDFGPSCPPEEADEDIETGSNQQNLHTHISLRDSDLSFKCLGEALARQEFSWRRHDSDSWTSSQLHKSITITEEDDEGEVNGWISSRSSSVCELQSINADLLACATVIASAKAQVVEVSGDSSRPRSSDISASSKDHSLVPDSNYFPPAPADIQHRLASLQRLQSENGIQGKKGWMQSRRFKSSTSLETSKLEDDDIGPLEVPFGGITPTASKVRVDIAMNSPPESPSSLSHDSPSMFKGWDSMPWGGTELHSYSTNDSVPTDHQHRITEILNGLDESISAFPSSLLTLESPCILAIRINLHKQENRPKRLNETSRQGSSATPSRPSIGLTAPLALSQRKYSVATTHTHPPPSIPRTPNRSMSVVVPNAPSAPPPPLPPPPARALAPPDLDVLCNIFPKASDLMRSALFAYILAYDFMEHSEVKTHMMSTPPSPRTSRAGSVPAKAASMLGMAQTDSFLNLPRITLSSGRTFTDIEVGLISCISRLVGSMKGGLATIGAQGKEGTNIDGVFVRALVEIVKGAELKAQEFL